MAQKTFLDRADDDGFIQPAKAVGELGDSTQQIMITKLYFLMRDCMPSGLVGALRHLHGDEVMAHLLYHHGETTPSRHKATKYAEPAFTRLKAWMAKGRSSRQPSLPACLQGCREDRMALP